MVCAFVVCSTFKKKAPKVIKEEIRKLAMGTTDVRVDVKLSKLSYKEPWDQKCAKEDSCAHWQEMK